MDVIDPGPMMDITKVTVMKVVMIGMIVEKEEMIDVMIAETIETETGIVIESKENLGSNERMVMPEITITEKVFLEMVPGKKMAREEDKEEVGVGEINQRNNFPISSSLNSVEYPLNIILIPVVTKSNVKTTKQKNLSEKLS